MARVDNVLIETKKILTNKSFYIGNMNHYHKLMRSDKWIVTHEDDGILVIPIVVDPPPKLRTKKGLAVEFHDRVYALLTIATMSGGCQSHEAVGKQKLESMRTINVVHESNLEINRKQIKISSKKYHQNFVSKV
ncbi:Glutamyl-tRNA(Gln) amidotransferase subunit A [Forsythia ovata]|uniref:Glutamyl-tRNA(Gln) amidotransferase subunit A n=1 Tax=Forsythia ovata TaxID=205694 RepID=A0ABD1S1K8_9LAMI